MIKLVVIVGKHNACTVHNTCSLYFTLFSSTTSDAGSITGGGGGEEEVGNVHIVFFILSLPPSDACSTNEGVLFMWS